MPHGVEQDVPTVVAGHEQTPEEIIDFASDAAGLGVQADPVAIDHLNRHRTE